MDERQAISFIQSHAFNKKVSSEIITVTPKIATMLLNMNWKENRPPSNATVNKYAHAIKHGHWTLNGEPMIMANNGVMIDGQQRCWAILEAEQPIDVMFVTGVEFDAVSTIDCGRPRSLSFLSGISTAPAAGLNFLLRLAYGNNESTAANLRTMEKVFGPSIQVVVGQHGSKRVPIFRQAPVTAAATLWHHYGHEEYVLTNLNGLLKVDSTHLSPIAKSFLSQCAYQVHSDKSRATGTLLFQRAFKVFDPNLRNATRLLIKDGTNEIDRARTMVIDAMNAAGVSLDLVPVETRKPKKVAKKKSK